MCVCVCVCVWVCVCGCVCVLCCTYACKVLFVVMHACVYSMPVHACAQLNCVSLLKEYYVKCLNQTNFLGDLPKKQGCHKFLLRMSSWIL